MKKSFVKMNVDDKELSLGNFCRLLKSLAVNKSAALQVEVFSCLFDVDSIQDTTVNNYCIGLRSIGDEYRQKYLILKKKYNKDKFKISDLRKKNSIICSLFSVLYRKNLFDDYS